MPQTLIDRCLKVRDILERRSCFLFGPRQTGKSTLIRQQLSEFPTFNLLDQELFVRLSRNPGLIRETLAPDATVAVIDEIQKMPALLNEVHLMAAVNLLLRCALGGFGCLRRGLPEGGSGRRGHRAQHRRL